MKPLQFLNTFCINNPSLEQVVNCIQDSDLSEEEVHRIKEASQLDAKHIIAKEFDRSFQSNLGFLMASSFNFLSPLIKAAW